jgi:hypothetical protein
MANEFASLEILSNRSGFNSAVRHIKKTITLMEEAGGKKNLADLLYQDDDEEMSGDRSALVVNILLVDKLGYKVVSTNLSSTVTDIASLAKEFEKWKGIDLVVTYHHPEMGLLVANPKIADELEAFGSLRKRELLVVYAGKGEAPADDDCQKAAELAISMFEGSKTKAPPSFLKGNFVVKASKQKAAPKAPKAPKAAAKRAKAPTRAAGARPAPAVAQRVAPPVITVAAEAPAAPAPAGPVRMTPRYAVVVQNELFHNGNVEAWKRIVASYKAAHPELQVYIYYDGERILDINSLFKWGKVKHGSAIEFAIAGNEIKDVAKLQRYLAQGASHQFEAFLRGPVNNVLKLF